MARWLWQRRAKLTNLSPQYTSPIGGGGTFAGRGISIQGALELVPVYRAVTLLSGAVGSLPLSVHRPATNGTTTELVTGSRAWQLLRGSPNPTMTANELWSLVESHLLLWGNAFIFKSRDDSGMVDGIWPVDPRRVLVKREIDNTLHYYIDGKTGEQYDDRTILHIRGLSPDGVVGYSPVQLARQMLGSEVAREEYKGRFWANDATPGVTLIHPNKLTPEGVDRLRALWDGRHKGVGKARETAVLGEGVVVKSLTIPMADAQFVDQAKLTRTDVALLFGLPPYMLAGETGSSMTYSNTETQSLDFVKWSLRPWLVRIEDAVSADPDLMPSTWCATFDTDELLRGSMTERYQAYEVAQWLLIDDIRAKEGLPPLPDGKGQVLNVKARETITVALPPPDGLPAPPGGTV
jgi:HK97 family phage portal protein